MSDQNTDFEFNILLKDGYILAESSGEETPENMAYVYETIIEKIAEWNCNRVLYIEKFSNQIPMQDMLLVWQNIFRKVEDSGVAGRIAVYDSVKEDYTVNTVSESLASAHGINARVFTDLDEALAWLQA
jgi:hypothetical protein